VVTDWVKFTYFIVDCQGQVGFDCPGCGAHRRIERLQ
jgi:hypothetical protein